jgi:hypothetical protein
VVKIRDYQEITKAVDPDTLQLTSLTMLSNPKLFVPGRKDDLHIATTNFSATRSIMPDGTPGVEVCPHDQLIQHMPYWHHAAMYVYVELFCGVCC